MACFGLKLGQDFGNRAARPYREFRGVPPGSFPRFYVRRETAPEGYSSEFSIGVCRPVLQILTQFLTKTCHFLHPFSDLASKIHTRFQTWPLKSIPVFGPLLYRNQVKLSSNDIFWILLFLYYSFGVEKTNSNKVFEDVLSLVDEAHTKLDRPFKTLLN